MKAYSGCLMAFAWAGLITCILTATGATPAPSTPSAATNAQEPVPPAIQWTPYNTRAHELDLWRIESRKWLRSEVVVSPDRSRMAYTEVSFMPDARQTIAALYGVMLPPEDEAIPSASQDTAPVAPASGQPGARKRRTTPRVHEAPTAAEIRQASRYEPDLQLQQRERWHQAGFRQTRPFRFETLTIVDWSASGQRLLFKRRSGILYYGLRTTDILLYDADRRLTSLYGDLQRAIRAHWQAQRAPDDARSREDWDDWDWDLVPLGFRPGSDSLILVSATAFEPSRRTAWGVWELDLDQRRVRLLSPANTPPPVAANGLLARSRLVYNPHTRQWQYATKAVSP